MPFMTIVFVRVVHKPQLPLIAPTQTFSNLIVEAIDPDATTSRYNRTWRVSRPREIQGEFLVGKLGFTTMTTERRTDYDEALKDFVEQPQQARQGHYVGWALDLTSQIMAFETKPPDIRTQSFVGALRNILDERPQYAFTVEHMPESAKFFEWVESLDRLTKFKARLRAPNPDFASRPQIVRAVLEGTNAERATIEMNAYGAGDSDDSLKIDATIRSLVAYGEDGYSEISARGERGGETKVYDSARNLYTERVEVPTESPIDGVWEHLLSAVRRWRRQ